MSDILKKHGFILVFAFAVGALIVWPTVSAIWKIGPDFKGVYPVLSNDEDQYLTMTREAYDGHFNLGSPYLSEHKDKPYLQASLAEIIFAEAAKFLNISVEKLFAINDFLLPFIGILLLYALLFAVAESRLVAGFFSVFYYILFISQFNRPINPQFSFLFLFLGLLLIWKIIFGREKSRKELTMLNFLLALVFGAAFYIYPFVWTSIFTVYVAILFLLAAYERRIMHHFRGFLSFFLPATVFALPYLLNLKNAAHDPNYADANLRFGFLLTHWPAAYFNVALMAICLAVLYFTGKDSDYRRNFFGYALAMSGIALNWQNIITGKALSFSMHYYWVVALFLAIIFSICAANLWRNYRNRNLNWKNLVTIFMMTMTLGGLYYKERGLSLLSGLIEPVDVAHFRSLQKLSGVADWFDRNSPHDSAILSFGRDYYWFIPAYTYDNDFQNANAGVFLISDDELESRWAIQNFFTKGVDADYIEKHDVEIWANKFIERYQNQLIKNRILGMIGLSKAGAPVEFMPKSYAERVLSKLNFYRKLGFEKSLKQYAADYILLDKNDPQYGFLAENFKKAPFLSLAAEIENNLIFRVVK